MRSHKKCANCGIVVLEGAHHQGEHRIRERYDTDTDIYCEACFFRAPDGSYERDGFAILNDANELVEKHVVLVTNEDGFVNKRYFDTRQAAAGSVGGNREAKYIGSRQVDPLILDL